jgi:hypothetical protein
MGEYLDVDTAMGKHPVSVCLPLPSLPHQSRSSFLHDLGRTDTARLEADRGGRVSGVLSAAAGSGLSMRLRDPEAILRLPSNIPYPVGDT